jgi:hypothetical protein
MKQIIYFVIYFLLTFNYSKNVLVLANNRTITELQLLQNENELLLEGGVLDASTNNSYFETSSQQENKKMYQEDAKIKTKPINEKLNSIFEDEINFPLKITKYSTSNIEDKSNFLKSDSKMITSNYFTTTPVEKIKNLIESNSSELIFDSKITTTIISTTQHFSTLITQNEENINTFTLISDLKPTLNIETNMETTSLSSLKLKPNFDEELDKYEISSEKFKNNYYENKTFTNEFRTKKVEEVLEKQTLPIIRNISMEITEEYITKTTPETKPTTKTSIKPKYSSIASFINNNSTKILSTFITKSTNSTKTFFSSIKNDLLVNNKLIIKTLPVTTKKLVMNKTSSTLVNNTTKTVVFSKLVQNKISTFETSLILTSLKLKKITTSTQFKTTFTEASTKSSFKTTVNFHSEENNVISIRFCPKHLENYCLNKGECILIQQAQYSNELPFNVIANCKCKTVPTHYYGLILVSFYGQRCELIGYSVSLAVIAYFVLAIAFFLILIILIKYKYKIIKQKGMKYFTNSIKHKSKRKYKKNENQRYFDRTRNKTSAADENDFESTNTFSNYFPLKQYQSNSTPFNINNHDGNFVFSNKNEMDVTNPSATHTARHLVVYPKPTRFSMVKNQSEAFLKMQKHNMYDGAFYY